MDGMVWKGLKNIIKISSVIIMIFWWYWYIMILITAMISWYIYIYISCTTVPHSNMFFMTISAITWRPIRPIRQSWTPRHDARHGIRRAFKLQGGGRYRELKQEIHQDISRYKPQIRWSLKLRCSNDGDANVLPGGISSSISKISMACELHKVSSRR